VEKNQKKEQRNTTGINSAVSARTALSRMKRTRKMQWIKTRLWCKFMLVRNRREVDTAILLCERLHLVTEPKSFLFHVCDQF